MTALTEFHQDDAEHISVQDSSFDAVISECSFCRFPDKISAAKEIARMIRPQGRLGLADIVVNVSLPDDLKTLAAWVACIGDARPTEEYLDIVGSVGFTDFMVEDHVGILRQMVTDIQDKLLAAKLAMKLGKINLSHRDLGLKTGKQLARRVVEMIDQGGITYITMVMTRG